VSRLYDENWLKLNEINLVRQIVDNLFSSIFCSVGRNLLYSLSFVLPCLRLLNVPGNQLRSSETGLTY